MDNVSSSLFDREFLEKLEYLYLMSKKLLSGKSRAERRSRKIGSGIEFADYREYVPGDDLRHIDWNLYARLGKLFLRLFEEEEDLYIYLLLDISPSMKMGRPPRLDYARRVAAALAYIALSNLDRVSIVTFGETLKTRLPPHRGKNNIFKVLNFLERLPEAKHTDIQESIHTFVHQNHRRGIAVTISDFFDQRGYERAFDFLRYYKYEIYAIQLYDQSELETTLRGDIELIDSESGDVLQTTLSPRLMAAYRKAFDDFCLELQQYCLRKEISLFSTATQIPFEELMLDIFRKGGFLQ
jgi:uncharacterized protein (DUF58 family)